MANGDSFCFWSHTSQPAKTPKTATKLKLTTPKTPATGESGKKTSAKPAKTKVTSAKKAKKEAKATSDGDTAEVSKESEVEKPLNPQEAKLKKEKEGNKFYLRSLISPIIFSLFSPLYSISGTFAVIASCTDLIPTSFVSSPQTPKRVPHT